MNLSDPEMIVMLECRNPSCRRDPKATGVGMKYKHYQPGKNFCPKCGKEMITKEQHNAEIELRQLGIKPSK
jgi:predicted RNA-binding Zn-ribbon protein involved in translation (DUF1610 family)